MQALNSDVDHDHDEIEIVIRNFNALSSQALQACITDEIQKLHDILPDSTIEVKTAETLANNQVEQCIGLVRDNLQDMYRKSSWGWSDARKHEEMTDFAQRFILITRANCIQGYISFQVVDEEGPCLYCYELQLLPELRSQSIGALLMHLMEKIGLRHGICTAMLTVFTANQRAIKFYRRVGYTLDASSPEPVTIRKTRRGTQKIVSDFIILSKVLD